MSTNEEVAALNREYLEAAGDVLRRVRDTIGHLYKHGPATIGMKFTTSGTDLSNPPSQYLDGTELADDAFYRFSWGTRGRQLSAGAAAIFGAAEGETVLERYWISAVYHRDGTLELRSAEGDVSVTEPEGKQVTPVCAVILKGQQDLGRKMLRKAIEAAFSHPVVTVEKPPPEPELDAWSPYDDRRW